MRLAILAQAFFGPAFLSFNNGILLVYFSFLHLERELILFYLALFPAIIFVLEPWLAHLADIRGRRKFGIYGGTLGFLGFVVIFLAGFYRENQPEIILLVGILVFSVGHAMFFAGWYAFIGPLVPGEMRGRFWGKLRFTWQLIAILFSGICTFLLVGHESSWLYQGM